MLLFSASLYSRQHFEKVIWQNGALFVSSKKKVEGWKTINQFHNQNGDRSAHWRPQTVVCETPLEKPMLKDLVEIPISSHPGGVAWGGVALGGVAWGESWVETTDGVQRVRRRMSLTRLWSPSLKKKTRRQQRRHQPSTLGQLSDILAGPGRGSCLIRPVRFWRL